MHSSFSKPGLSPQAIDLDQNAGQFGKTSQKNEYFRNIIISDLD